MNTLSLILAAAFLRGIFDNRDPKPTDRAEVKVKETEIEFPTYGFSDPDPVPQTGSPLYPYFRFDG